MFLISVCESHSEARLIHHEVDACIVSSVRYVPD